jgi:hypothetical protein
MAEVFHVTHIFLLQSPSQSPTIQFAECFT